MQWKSAGYTYGVGSGNYVQLPTSDKYNEIAVYVNINTGNNDRHVMVIPRSAVQFDGGIYIMGATGTPSYGSSHIRFSITGERKLYIRDVFYGSSSMDSATNPALEVLYR